MSIHDRDWYHEHRDQVAAVDRVRGYQSVQQRDKPFSVWQQIGLFLLICFAVLGAVFMVVFARAYWLR